MERDVVAGVESGILGAVVVFEDEGIVVVVGLGRLASGEGPGEGTG